MTDKIKVLTIIGTRPEIIKLSRVMAVLDELTDHTIVHTGQNYDYELNQIFFDQLGLRKPDYFLDAAGETGAQTVGQVMVKFDQLLESIELPDALVVLGDTNSCMGAYAAKRKRMPIFHMEAGNRCFDERVPEEINRRIIDHMSEINLVYSEHARDNLLREGMDSARVIKTGSPMAEIFDHYNSDIKSSDILRTLELKEGEYFLVSLHREDNVDAPEKLKSLVQSLEEMAKHYERPVIFSVHPRTRKRLEAMQSIDVEGSEHVFFMKPLGFFDYVHLQQHAFCVISDSGTLTEESSLLGFPAVMLREAHERPEGMDEAAVVMADFGSLPQAVDITVKTRDKTRAVSDYVVDNVSVKMARLIASYIGYSKRVVWRDYSTAE